MEILSNFAVFEGGDGSGTSTQLTLLTKKFAADISAGPVFYPTFEPTEGNIGRLARGTLKKELVFRPETLARLFAADRGEHLFAPDGIYNRCRQGELVVCDRYVLSSLVYQGLDCGDDLPRVLNEDFPAPELLLFFDVDPSIAQQRLGARLSLEMFEDLEFQEKVREKYLSLLSWYSDGGVRVEIINAAQAIEKTAAEVWGALSKMPILQ